MLKKRIPSIHPRKLELVLATGESVRRGSWSFQQGVMWVLDLNTGQSPAAAPPRIPVKFGELIPSDLDALSMALTLESPDHSAKDQALRRFERGSRCFAFWTDGGAERRIACYGWASQVTEWIGEMQIHFRMGAGEAYIWDCFTLADFRRQGLYSALLDRITSALKEDGVRRFWIGSNLENRPSIKGFENAGFGPAIKVWFARPWFVLFFWITGYPGAPEGLVSAARRAYAGERGLRLGPLVVPRSGRGSGESA